MFHVDNLNNAKKLKLARNCRKKAEALITITKKNYKTTLYTRYMIIHARIMMLLPMVSTAYEDGYTWNKVLQELRGNLILNQKSKDCKKGA